MTVQEMLRRAARRSGMSEAEMRSAFYALLAEWKESLARLDDVRLPGLGRLKSRLGDSNERRTPVYPICALCEDGVRATPNHVRSKHAMPWKEYKEEFGGMAWVKGESQHRVYVSFKMFRGAKDTLIHCGPLAQILEDE